MLQLPATSDNDGSHVPTNLLIELSPGPEAGLKLRKGTHMMSNFTNRLHAKDQIESAQLWNLNNASIYSLCSTHGINGLHTVDRCQAVLPSSNIIPIHQPHISNSCY
jgi:hypothetical protein